jgi:hypothetical protein
MALDKDSVYSIVVVEEVEDAPPLYDDDVVMAGELPPAYAE